MSFTARPYAVAFLDVMPKGYDVAAFLSASASLRQALARDTRVRAFFGSPAIPEKAKAAVLNELCRKAGIDDLGARFFRLALSRHRILQLSEILRAIQDEWDHRSDVVQASVTVAASVSEEERRSIEEAISARVGKKVRAKVELDPSILAGFVARVGSAIYDASAAQAIDRFRQQVREEGT